VSVVAIHLGEKAEGPLEEAESARAVAGKGLADDRHFIRTVPLPARH